MNKTTPTTQDGTYIVIFERTKYIANGDHNRYNSDKRFKKTFGGNFQWHLFRLTFKVETLAQDKEMQYLITHFKKAGYTQKITKL